MADTPPIPQNDDLDKLMSDDNGLAQDWGDPGPPSPQTGEGGGFGGGPHSFGPPSPSSSSDGSTARPLDFILDIPLEISVELGRTRMVINDLLRLGQGSVVELSKLAGEPQEIFVNGKLVARGEVVVVNEKFGVRVTDIVSPMERIKSLTGP
ncbi:MAG: flagellar motor switch protein FliN [Candidatus Adiutrix sp.]|jgi:flagellar motor switch protein FliN/FliY|nr:flagellar motor switch protein FliN [Candidatus Adiutrix sp.]